MPLVFSKVVWHLSVTKSDSVWTLQFLEILTVKPIKVNDEQRKNTKIYKFGKIPTEIY